MDSIKIKQFKVDFDPIEHSILYGYRGSIAHNLYIPPDKPMATDDIDYMGVCIAPIDCYWGLGTFEQKEMWQGSDDIVIYDIRKFFKLLLKSNPNVISFLWNDLTMFKCATESGLILMQSRDIFSSQQIYYSFIGYAKSQLYKMTHQAYQGYMGVKRKALVDQFGYDCKNASCLIRLLKLGSEFLETSIMNVYRTEDRDELIAIKQGKISLPQIETMAEKLFARIELAKAETSLPEYPDFEKANKLLISILASHRWEYC